MISDVKYGWYYIDNITVLHVLLAAVNVRGLIIDLWQSEEIYLRMNRFEIAYCIFLVNWWDIRFSKRKKK